MTNEEIIIKSISLIDNGSCKYDKHTRYWDPDGDEGRGKHLTKDHDGRFNNKNTLSKLQDLKDVVMSLTGLSRLSMPLHLESIDGVLQSFTYDDTKYDTDTLTLAFDELLIEIES